MEPSDVMDGDTLVLDELVRECRRRGYLVVALSREEKVQAICVLLGILYGWMLFGGGRG